MKVQTVAAPRGSGELSPYQQRIRDVLIEIAALAPRANDAVSETALYIRTVKLGAIKEHREVVRTAWELIQDRGYARREHLHYRFRRPFSSADVDGLMSWRGVWAAPERTENSNR